jgi:hypothetical protein
LALCLLDGGTAIIAGKDKAQVQQKYYRYTGVVFAAFAEDVGTNV